MPPPDLQIHTYHCLCTTHLLTTPYALSSLPCRASPALDNASILPLPPLSSFDTSDPSPTKEEATTEEEVTTEEEATMEEEAATKENVLLPSLLSPSLRLARKMVVVRREDGFERRRVWRCGRCGVGVGYEVLRAGEDKGEGERDRERGRVMYLLEGGLRETGEMMGGGVDG